MADQAKITSLDALESFRASLILFVHKTRASVEEVSSEIRRTGAWVQTEQRLHWEGEIRRRRKAHDQAQQELLSARISSIRGDLTLQTAAVRKTKQALDDAENKMRSVKRWTRDFEPAVAAPSKKLDSVRQLLDHEMPKAIAYLLETQKILEGYTDVAPDNILPSSPSEVQTPPSDSSNFS
ncbi:MAG: hypothetical protein ABIP97_00280 [Chthoniobacterales bacterium]